MKNGTVYCWLVLRVDQAPGRRWKTCKSRTAARLFRAVFGGEIFRVLRTH